MKWAWPVDAILSAEDLSQLERLALVSRAAISPQPGRRRGSSQGDSIEFDDYRHYQPGDDPRYIDWNIYGRLDKLLLRLFRAESELTVHLLVDTSSSMAFGASEKLAWARKIAAAISYVAARQLDSVGVATFADGIQQVLPPRRGKPQLVRILEMLSGLRAAGTSEITRSLVEYTSLSRRPGLAIVISDFFAPEGCLEGLSYLSHKRFTVALVHVLADEELHPAVEEGAEIVDLEQDAAATPVVVDADAIAAYRRRIADFIADLEAACLDRGMLYIPAVSSQQFDALIVRCMQAALWRAQA